MYESVAEFQSYLTGAKITWAKGVTVHHTWRPTLAQWRASSTTNNLKGLVRTWRDQNGWDTGPNIVIAPEGIILASGLSAPGIHAGVCNSAYIGIEIVGDYDNAPWQEPIRSLVYGAVDALARKLNLTTRDIVSSKRINGHRECNSPKSCPGNAIDLNAFRSSIANGMNQQDANVIGVPPSCTLAQFQQYAKKYKAPLPEHEVADVYGLAKDLEVDPAFFIALWKQEAFENMAIGNSELQNQSNCPINIVESQDFFRRHVVYKGRKWRAFSTRKLGCYDALVYLKEVHGSAGRLSVRQIIPVHSPASDNNPVETIISNILTRMKEMKSL